MDNQQLENHKSCK